MIQLINLFNPKSKLKFERGDRLPKEEVLPKIAGFFKVDLEDFRIQYLSDKVIYPILEEHHARNFGSSRSKT